jgi:hypothetical protein
MMNTAFDAPPSAGQPAVAQPAAARTSRLGAAIGAARLTLQWRLLLLWTGVLLLPACAAALPVWQLLSANLDHSLYASALATRLDAIAVADLGGVISRNGPATATGSLIALVLTLLLSPLLSGMTIAAARAPQRLGIAALAAGGMQEYPRLLRMMVWALLPLGIAGALGGVALGAAHTYGEHAILESDAGHVKLAATVGAALLFLLADATLDAGRAVLAIDRRRKSAVRAWWDGCRLFRRSPLAFLGSWFGISVLGLALAALLAIARINVPALGVGGFIAAFVLAQLAVAAVAWMRNARLVALMEVARAAKL